MWLLLEKLTNSLDWVAGWVVLGTMLLVTGNVVLRPFDHPIGGTYEWTGLLTSLAVGLALAHCAIKGGHTVITLVVDRFPDRLAKVNQTAVHILTSAFLLLAGWRVADYGFVTWRSGEVAPTTKIPFYPIMFIVAGGIVVYAIVELANVVRSLADTEKPGAMDFYAAAAIDSCPVPPADIQDQKTP
ncbi:MAG: TRAP transporter small permease [Actinobacteria bacterium]|nr:TRAP transporter small permease [Actinomycetota bacterium]